MVYAIVVAGGSGTRIGLKKQFYPLAGRPVWQRSVQSLRDGGVEHFWLVVPAEDLDRAREQIAESGLAATVRVVAGGASRLQSVRCGLDAVAEEALGPAPENALIVVHDAARPFVSPADVHAVIDAARLHGAAILAEPVTDTVKRATHGVVTGTVPREDLWLAQTPQVARLDWMLNAYRQQGRSADATDDAALLEAAGYRVRIVCATEENRKITTPGDLRYAEWLAEQRWGR